MNLHRSWFWFAGGTFSGPFVGSSAFDLDGGIDGWALKNRPDEFRQRGFHLFTRNNGGIFENGDLPVDVVSGTRSPQQECSAIQLGQFLDKGDQTRRQARTDDQHPCSKRIKCAGMTQSHPA